MKCIIQRVTKASVEVDGQKIGQINRGYVILLGVEVNDTAFEELKLLKKILELRLFRKDSGSFEQSLMDIQGDALLIPQFTLMANCKKGRRPSFSSVAPPNVAKPLWDQFVTDFKKAPIGHVATGQFGANMQVALINDGPVTIGLDTADF